MFDLKITATLQQAGLALPHMAMAPSLAGAWGAHLKTVLPQAKQLLLVMDSHTRTALGEQAQAELARDFSADTCLLPGTPLPDETTLARILSAAKTADALIAVGGGTINDACKLASYRLQKPYAVLPTAPSMNGYTSANASIITHGVKHSVAAHLPCAVLCDLGVLSVSPARLRRAGIGDSLARATAQADWLLSHHLLDTPYDPRPFALTAAEEALLLAQAPHIMEGTPESLATLMRLLVLSGFGMTLCGGSYPASQAEHMLAHTMEILGAPPGLHGEEIGVTTLFMARMQERFAGQNAITLKQTAFPLAEMQKAFGTDATRAFQEEYASKAELMSTLQDRGELQTRWQNARSAIAPIRLPAAQIAGLLQTIGAPETPERLGWTKESFAKAAHLARFTRRRFTFLDIDPVD